MDSPAHSHSDIDEDGDVDIDLEADGLDLYEDGEDFLLLEGDDSEPEPDTDPDTDTDVDADADSDAGESPSIPPVPTPLLSGLDEVRVVAEADRCLPARMSTFEYACILATRAHAISTGAPAFVDILPNDSAEDIARRELRARRSLRVLRHYEHFDHATGRREKRVEYWRAAEMTLPL